MEKDSVTRFGARNSGCDSNDAPVSEPLSFADCCEHDRLNKGKMLNPDRVITLNFLSFCIRPHPPKEGLAGF